MRSRDLIVDRRSSKSTGFTEIVVGTGVLAVQDLGPVGECRQEDKGHFGEIRTLAPEPGHQLVTA